MNSVCVSGLSGMRCRATWPVMCRYCSQISYTRPVLSQCESKGVFVDMLVHNRVKLRYNGLAYNISWDIAYDCSRSRHLSI